MSVVPAGTLYRGKVGMWSWVLHRISGVAIFFFLLVHILDTALVRVSPEAYNVVIESYKTPVIGLAELGLVGAILFHGLNGVRIILVDFWSKPVTQTFKSSIVRWNERSLLRISWEPKKSDRSTHSTMPWLLVHVRLSSAPEVTALCLVVTTRGCSLQAIFMFWILVCLPTWTRASANDPT